MWIILLTTSSSLWLDFKYFKTYFEMSEPTPKQKLRAQKLWFRNKKAGREGWLPGGLTGRSWICFNNKITGWALSCLNLLPRVAWLEEKSHPALPLSLLPSLPPPLRTTGPSWASLSLTLSLPRWNFQLGGFRKVKWTRDISPTVL